MKRLFKWTLRLMLLAVVLVVIFYLSLDSILRLVVEHSIRQQPELHGMQVEIGKFHLGLFDPVVDIKDLKLYNPPQFGGTPFLNIPEIHVAYDREELRRGIIHITLLRFNLGELDVVKSADGQTNLLALGVALPAKKSTATAGNNNPQLGDLKKKYDLDFKGIDCLNVSVGTFKYLDLQDRKNDHEQKIGLDNCVITNVTSQADLFGLGVVVGLRSDDFFRPLIDPNGAGHSSSDLFKILGK